ncbi:MAG TPA: amylo-alpha-1,6-glucosidase [Chloroflexota bacterium]|nr:amylo-alpha-1,6-glucosidase [Chloroflexota bacterium]
MTDVVRRMSWSGVSVEGTEPLMTREWLVTNGIGGYASGTISGVPTRRYHGFLIAALPAPLGRVVMLTHLSEQLRLPQGKVVWLGAAERADGSIEMPGATYLTEFRLEAGIPVWQYKVGDFILEKRIIMPHEQNTVHINYRLLAGNGIARLKLRPSVHFRPHETPVSEPLSERYVLTAENSRYELSAGNALPPLRTFIHGERSAFTLEGQRIREILHRIEERRGYDAVGDLWTPGYFRVDLATDSEVTLVASTEDWPTIMALSPVDALATERNRRAALIDAAVPAARTGIAAELVLAADQFVISPIGRVAEAARASAAGDKIRTVIAGYHWFSDWGRDTMISLEGLTLTTGHRREAGAILRTFSHYFRNGLIPNMFPEHDTEGLYHTADASLWFFHAVHRYFDATGDRATLRLLLPTLQSIVDHHLRGTRFGIGVDPADGLLRQGAEGFQLTWMDAKVGDWVVTPRRGKAVEINALWYNALCLLAEWIEQEQGKGAARALVKQAERARRSFNDRFWYVEGGYLYDIVDGEQGDDPACRPNQILAISLDHPILESGRWESVFQVVHDRLLTPVGLRSLAPDHPDYQPRYYGNLRARDAAYHQGTVWPWLIGPFIDAWIRVRPGDLASARRLLDGFEEHLGEACIGSISEIHDAEAPFTSRGCISQAWSVAEVLRCLVRTAE